MSADPRDDFSGFAGAEHMFFGLEQPFQMIRRHVEDGLREQVADTVVDAIVMEGEPKFLTLGRKTEDARTVIVGHFGFCLMARLTLSCNGGRTRETLPAALTFLFGNVDKKDDTRMQTHFDPHGDASAGFDEATFKRRLLEFRATLS
jgi:hypothetical protein